MKSIISILFILAFSACVFYKDDENHHYTIMFINNHDSSIYVGEDYEYPDTMKLRTVYMLASCPETNKIDPKTKNDNVLFDFFPWEAKFNNKRYIANDTLMIFVLDAKLLESRTVHARNTILQRYDLSLQDLQRLNWVLTYPPTEAMKGVKMWPPYKKQE